MDDILLQKSARSHVRDEKSVAELKARVKTFTTDAGLTWGRAHNVSLLTSLGCAGIMCLCPTLVIFVWISMEYFGGSLFAAIAGVIDDGVLDFCAKYGPELSMQACIGYTLWVSFQAALYQFLPSKLSTGQLTPAGHLLQYYTNGFAAWIVTHIAYVAASYFGLINPAFLAQNWAGLLVAANVYGFLLSGFAWAKAHIAPTHVEDRKFSGSWLYDMYMGIEFNPRFGQYWDFKLFHNGRPGIVAWTLIDISFACHQYQLHGTVSNSMMIVNLFHMIYVVDFFYHEDWYLRTIDICHDHFGFYLAWGSMVWLPAMYTLQTQYLARYPVHLSNPVALLILCTGLSGYFIFRAVNNQKDLARKTKGDCMIWGKKAEFIQAKYTTADGKEHQTLLLASGK